MIGDNTQQEDVKKVGKKQQFLTGCLFLIVLGIFGFLWVNSKDSPATKDSSSSVSQVSEADKAKAQKELDSLMALTKQAEVVTSYEFSDKAKVIYVGPSWYKQTVIFKKDFMAKVAMLKDTATGYRRFEVRDALSNQKVAEVTALTGSIEVYK